MGQARSLHTILASQHIGSAEEPTEACRDVARDSVEVIEISPIVVKAAAAEEPNETAGLQLE
jgi:hypothetical protein